MRHHDNKFKLRQTVLVKNNKIVKEHCIYMQKIYTRYPREDDSPWKHDTKTTVVMRTMANLTKYAKHSRQSSKKKPQDILSKHQYQQGNTSETRYHNTISPPVQR